MRKIISILTLVMVTLFGNTLCLSQESNELSARLIKIKEFNNRDEYDNYVKSHKKEVKIYKNKTKYPKREEVEIGKEKIYYKYPDSSFKIAFPRGEVGQGCPGIYDFYDDKGNLLSHNEVFDFDGNSEFAFSENDEYILISIGFYGKGGIALFTKGGKLLWKEIKEDWYPQSNYFIEDNKRIIVASPKGMKNSGIYCYSIEGKQIWYYPDGANPVIFSSDGKDLACLTFAEDNYTIIHIININSGKLVNKVFLPINYKFYPSDKRVKSTLIINRKDYIIYKDAGSSIYPGKEESKSIYLFDKKKGDIIWKKEKVPLSEDIDVDLDEEEQFIVEENKKITIYKIKGD